MAVQSNMINIQEITRHKVTELLLFLLIVTLPFFNVRSMFGGLPLVFFVEVAIIIFFSILLFRNKAKLKYEYFDGLLVTYLLWSMMSFALNGDASSSIVLLKTVFYFVFYFSLKSLLLNLDASRVREVMAKSIIYGCIFYFVFVVYLYVNAGISFSLNNFNYWGFTHRLFSDSTFSLSGDDVIRSADLMRNAMGEVFALYFLSLLLTCDNRWVCIATKILSFLFVIMMFSRRAFYSSIFGFVFARRSKSKIFVVLAVLFVVVVGYIANVVVSENRLLTVESNERLEMYSKTLELAEENFLFGFGYGAKLDDKTYVHNFVISSLFMTGVVGGLISLLIVIELYKNVVYGMFHNNRKMGLLLIIPVFGAMVGSTVEGMFTVTSWCVFAFFTALFDENRMALSSADIKNGTR